MKELSIVWFRNDLRIHDNEALLQAMNNAQLTIPVYIFDERVFRGRTSFGFPKTDVHRAKFILDSVLDLKKNLQSIGLDLYIRIGKPEEEIAHLASIYKAGMVYCNRERTQEEVKVQDRLEQKLWELGQEMVYTRGKMLFYTSDLPFPIRHTPDVFTSFRKEVEKFVEVRKPLPTPQKINQKLPFDLEWGSVPTLDDLGYTADQQSILKSNRFKGGETAALAQLKYYLWDSDLIQNYKETRNDLLGWEFSTKFSPWLAAGCLSPKLIYHEIRKYEKEVKSNESTYWVIFELLWRDFFRLLGKKYENKIFQIGGTLGGKVSDRVDYDLFAKWANGETGIPFVDANMRELNETGFMSNRGRQNVASFLVKDLKLNWILGAEYFESKLIDYDPCSNYGNWNYVAGVGSDPREDRYFNILVQAKRYDPKAEYILHWVPELKSLPLEYIFQPDLMDQKTQSKYGCKLGVHYPVPLVASKRWAK